MKERKISKIRGQRLTGVISDGSYPAGVRCYSTNTLKGDLIWQINNTSNLGLTQTGKLDLRRSDFTLRVEQGLLTTAQSQLSCQCAQEQAL